MPAQQHAAELAHVVQTVFLVCKVVFSWWNSVVDRQYTAETGHVFVRRKILISVSLSKNIIWSKKKKKGKMCP